jgi:SWI/SNF-related matrix-associated actin-dependent regulator 1 of chromatin subfamily A
MYHKLWDEYVEQKKLLGKRTNESQKDLVELILLRQFIAQEAIPYTIEMVENAIEMGRKVIVFTSFSDELEAIANHFGKAAVKHNGPMSSAKKQHSVDQFQNNDKIKVFVGNIKSAGVGITLTEATVVIFNSFDWVTGNNEQAEDRAYRIGQNNDVNVYYQLFEDTISVRMWETLKQKKQVINTILGVDNASKEDETDLLIQKILDGEL